MIKVVEGKVVQLRSGQGNAVKLTTSKFTFW